jgi:hypothetical protein
MRVETPDLRGLVRVEMRVETLRGRLEEAGQGHFDPDASVEPIRALLDQGCDFEADVVPIVAREVPELPRPLKNWGAPWLIFGETATFRSRSLSAPPSFRRRRNSIERWPTPRGRPGGMLLADRCDLEADVLPTVARTVPAAMHCLRVSYRADAAAVVCSLAIRA